MSVFFNVRHKKGTPEESNWQESRQQESRQQKTETAVGGLREPVEIRLVLQGKFQTAAFTLCSPSETSDFYPAGWKV